MSALLTTTMNYMKEVIDALEAAGVRKDVKVMIGGAPVTDAFAQQIGADGYSENANGAVALARKLVAEAVRAEDASACTTQLRAVMNEAAALKEKRAFIEEQRQSNAQALRRIEDAAAAMAQASTHISEWDEALIRQLVDTVKVNSAEKITVFLRGGVQVEQDMI